MTRLIDLTGPIYSGMWHYASPYFSPEVEELPIPEWLERPVYSEQIRMPLQTGTYIETSAHCTKDDPRIDDYPLERTTLLPTVSVWVPTPGGEAVTRARVEEGIARAGLELDQLKGMGLLIGTGWDSHWDDKDFTTACPWLEDGVSDLAIEVGVSLVGGDTPRFENPEAPSGALSRLFAERMLLLAPLVNLGEVGDRIGRIIASPLRIPAASATPCRAVFVLDD